ncbi:MAG: hypothetical protein N2234_05910 [Planctomycetota bacterium]|nr:hypothetical protein [Planctomycetota bacterium]
MGFYHLIWLVGFVVLLLATGGILDEKLRSRTLRLTFVPGFLLTAGLSALFCEIGRIDKRHIAVLDPRKETESYLENASRTKRYLLTLGPFLVEFALLCLTFYLLGLRVKVTGVWDANLPELLAVLQRFGYTLTDVLVGALNLLYNALIEASKGKFLDVICLYVAISLLIAMIPPKKHAKRILLGFTTLGLLSSLFSLLGLKMEFARRPLESIGAVLATATGLAFWVFAVAVICVWLPNKLSKQKKESSYNKTGGER